MIDNWCRENYLRGCPWDTHVIYYQSDHAWTLPGAITHSIHPYQIPALLKDLKPDLAIHHNPLSEDGRLPDLPWVWWLHSSWIQMQPAPDWGLPKAVIRVVAPANQHASWQKFPLVTIPNWVDSAQYTIRHHSQQPVLICGIVGRQHPDKLPFSFLDTLIATDITPWRIWLIGRGMDHPTFQLYVRSAIQHVAWVQDCGEIPPEDMPNIYPLLDAVMIPTAPEVGEGCPMTALEAMASGLPVIGRDCDGIRQTCGEAALYGVTDRELLAQLQPLQSAETRMRLGQLGRQRVEQYFNRLNWDRINQILLGALTKGANEW
ncbi:MAG: glycosyltransferase family 4 protein [Gloeomargarita sp. SKYB31]|nr:glycosyltransferase family 4 protein [Gloeomargarita sp. SKYB31]